MHEQIYALVGALAHIFRVVALKAAIHLETAAFLVELANNTLRSPSGNELLFRISERTIATHHRADVWNYQSVTTI